MVARARKYHQEVTGARGPIISAHTDKQDWETGLQEAGVELRRPAVQSWLENQAIILKTYIRFCSGTIVNYISPPQMFKYFAPDLRRRGAANQHLRLARPGGPGLRPAADIQGRCRYKIAPNSSFNLAGSEPQDRPDGAAHFCPHLGGGGAVQGIAVTSMLCRII